MVRRWIDYLCEIVSTAKPQIDGGTVKGIAMMTKERSKVLPDVPTGIEQGVPNLEAYTWNAIFLPKGALAEMVNKLNRATVEAMESPNVSERLEGLGAVIVPPVRATPEYLAHFVRSEIEKWTGPIKASGVTVSEQDRFRGTCARNHRALGQSHGTQRQAETPLQLLYAPFVKTIAFRAPYRTTVRCSPAVVGRP